jgi:hypothetical protein
MAVTVGQYTYATDSYDARPHVLLTLTKTLANNTTTTLDVGSVLYNVGGMYTSGTTVTTTTDGIFEVGLALRYATNATGVRQARCTVAGSSGYYYEEKNALSGQNTSMSWTFEDSLTSGTTITFDGFQTSGGNLALTGLCRGWVRLLVAT